MFEVKARSEESWGLLASCDDGVFNKIINDRKGSTKEVIKTHIKKQKKLKKYRVQFLKESRTDYFVVEAESDYDVSSVAREFFKKNKDTMEFKEKQPSKWAGNDLEYDRLSYVKMR